VVRKTINFLSPIQPAPPIFKKLQSDPLLIWPKLASVLAQSNPFPIHAHLWGADADYQQCQLLWCCELMVEHKLTWFTF